MLGIFFKNRRRPFFLISTDRMLILDPIEMMEVFLKYSEAAFLSVVAFQKGISMCANYSGRHRHLKYPAPVFPRQPPSPSSSFLLCPVTK